ncbi:substrate binding domain-containing protein [Burkholderia catarinensis]|uniref:substrate binding domain-containing protein n=1 Tax=Burkholderia catarinensis TaxID=1108140 RepID=UPI000A8E3AB0|nr:substrate binding domain-containing protein [Burkholderia catarinensis]KAG8148392.1 hypothetical protein BFF94_038355 [Burkholderia catarinensis]
MRNSSVDPPGGHLRILSTPGFGRKIVVPLSSDFHARYPDITVELLLSDSLVDLIADHIDVCIRENPVADNSVVARQLMPRQLVVCASRVHARMHGLQGHVGEIAHHRCISFRAESGSIEAWTFKVDPLTRWCSPIEPHTFNDTGLIVQTALDGFGIAQLPAYQVCGPLAEGRMIRCLSQYAPEDDGIFLCYPDGIA